MSLRELAEQDLGAILEDGVTGWGWRITLTDPNGKSDNGLTGFSNDIAQAIDPDTGALVSGRSVSVALRLSTLQRRGFTVPRGVADSTRKPWRVTFADINGAEHTFKVARADPDTSIGVVVCLLETYAP